MKLIRQRDNVISTQLLHKKASELEALGKMGMRIASVEIKGFRCFDEDGQTIFLDDFTCFIGPNASGKTAAMTALVRMFDERQIDRIITKNDFHVAPGEDLRDKKERRLSIEARLVFPELERVEGARSASIPEFFRQMTVDERDGSPYCRIRLEATWTDDGTADGDVKQRLYWVTAPVDAEEKDVHKQPVEAWQRSRIRIVYGAAVRDVANQLRPRSTSAFGRLLRAIDWADKESEVKKQLDALEELLSSLPGLRTIIDQVQKAWDELYPGRVARRVEIGPASSEAARLLERLEVTFEPDEQGGTIRTSELSDGLRALFSLAFPVGLYTVSKKLWNSTDPGFVDHVLDELPVLTIFAIEEPENHLSPHYLGRVVRLLQEIASGEHAQVVLSSHSPSILQRVEPDNVRYFLGGENRASTRVLPIPLPDENESEAYTYVREAVRGYPELYFSRLVVLGEGPSEEIVFRKVFDASGAPLDVEFISVVPLGGRHVHHFWRLLNGLNIPHITVLDFDYGKKHGGEARIKAIIDQLVDLHGDVVRDEVSRALECEPDDRAGALLRLLRDKYNVFFVAPLDLDWAMLQTFPDVYKALASPGRGPQFPDKEPGRTKVLVQRVRHVLGLDARDEIPSKYAPETYELFAWYKYLFLDRSKPAAHMRAMSHLVKGPDWIKRLPDPLPKIVERAKSLLREKDGFNEKMER